MRCIICENKNLTLFKKINDKSIYECRNCSLAMTLEKERGKLEIREKSNYLNFYNFNEYKKSEIKLKKRIKKLIKIITKFKKKGNVLDVGAGFGLFSALLLKCKDFRITIVEPVLDPNYINKNEILYHKKNVEEFLKFNKNKYDLILLIDVLEHFKDPLLNLKKLKKILKSDGYIIIQVPNYKSLMAKSCTNWAWWMVEEHKFHFSPKSIYYLLKKAGYNIKFFMTYEDLIDFKKNLDGNFNNLNLLFLRKVVKLLFYPLFFFLYYLSRTFFWRLRFGGLIFLIACLESKKY